MHDVQDVRVCPQLRANSKQSSEGTAPNAIVAFLDGWAFATAGSRVQPSEDVEPTPEWTNNPLLPPVI